MSLFNIPLPEPVWVERKGRVYSPDDEDIVGCGVTPLYTAEQMEKYAKRILDAVLVYGGENEQP